MNVAIIGGGLVGAMQACLLGQRGLRVHVYESRPDTRGSSQVAEGRSINLALSERGRSALRLVGLEKDIIGRNSVPMKARMVHSVDGKNTAIHYTRDGQCIYSTGRRMLNEKLLSVAEKQTGVSLNFEHKLVGCNLQKGTMEFKRPDGTTVSATADLVLGCDGAFSTVRRHMLKSTRFNFSQTYIPHGYMEFTVPATADGKFAMEANYLHIWPRGEFMLTALPNPNGDFTATLFMPFAVFESLTNPSQLLRFFENNFPDVLPLLGRKYVVRNFFGTSPSSVVSIKCRPYHIEDKCLLLGDASHAMVPFYGQGLNAGFEDCLIFLDMLDNNHNNLAKTLDEYSSFRNPDAEAICDLAMYNYVEMRHLVNKASFRFRKRLDTVLHYLFPNSWIPLYTLVTFSRTRYHLCWQNKTWQDRILRKSVFLLLAFLAMPSVAWIIQQRYYV